MSERKASEILIDLETRIKNMEKQLKLQEFQLRLIVSNFNKLFKVTGDSQLPDYLQIKSKSTDDKIKTIELTQSIIERKNKLQQIQQAIAPDADFSFKTEVRDANVKLVPVTQLLNYTNGAPVVSANINVMDENGKSLRKLTTNTVGRWQIFLPPGDYMVNVKGNNDGIEFTQSFKVVDSNAPIALTAPPLQLLLNK